MAKDSIVRNNIWKWLILGLIAAVSVHVTFPAKEKLRFGLDLKGGTSFTLGVDTEKLADTIVAADLSVTNDAGRLERRIEETLKDCDERITSVIRKRVDAMGTNEPVIQSLPKKHQLIVQLPGVDKEVRDQAKARLQSAAFLEFRLTHPRDAKLVNDLLAKDIAPEGYEKAGNGYVRAANWAEVVKQPGYATRLATWQTTDDRYRFMLEDRGVDEDSKDGKRVYAPHFVSRNVELTGNELERASWE